MTEAFEPVKKAVPKSEGAAMPFEVIAEQKLSEEDERLKNEAYGRLLDWQQTCEKYHNDAKKCRNVYRLNDPEQDEPKTPYNERTLQLQTLKSTINNCIADQLDNTQEAMMVPEQPEVQPLATEMTDVVNFILDQNDYPTFCRTRDEDFFITGTAVTQIGWDDDMDNGHGNIRLQLHPIENMVWDTSAEDIQDARAIIKCTWHPMSWYADHFPDTAMYIADEENEHNNVGVPESLIDALETHEGRAMLMEYWYRRYDAKKKRYSINVAYFAGGALLDKMTDVYAHGRYPFVFDAFTRIPGQPVGEGMVHELAPMMRYINRYARYIDENLRFSCKNRMLARKGSGINLKQLADWNQNIVEGDVIDDDAVRWFDTKPLNGMVNQQMLQFQNDMKMDSGQNQFSRGETAGGVTAASAISALQEAGGKITRMRTQILSAGFKKMVEQILWLIAQYYDEDRQRMIIGENLQPKTITLSAAHLMPGGHLKDGHIPPPPYTVQVQVQRRNPLRVQAQNDLMIQAYTMAAQAGQNFPLRVLFELLNVDGKDKIIPVLEEVEQNTAMMQQMMMQNQQLTEENENLRTSIDAMGSALSKDVSDLQEQSFGVMTE